MTAAGWRSFSVSWVSTACLPNCRRCCRSDRSLRICHWKAGKQRGAGPLQPLKSRLVEPKYQTVNTPEALDELVTRLSRPLNRWPCPLPAPVLSPMSAQIVGISFSPAEGEAYYIPVAPPGAFSDGQLAPGYGYQPSETGPGKQLLSPRYVHNSKYDLILLAENGIYSE